MVGTVLFPGLEVLEVFGPAEVYNPAPIRWIEAMDSRVELMTRVCTRPRPPAADELSGPLSREG